MLDLPGCLTNYLPPSAVVGLDLRTPLPPGVSLLPNHKPRVPPPPGEDNRDVSTLNLRGDANKLVKSQFSVAAFSAVAERGDQCRWTQDPSSPGEDPPAEGDPAGAAHRPCRSRE